MAKWLASHGYKVSMITWDEGQPDGELVDGVRVYKMCDRDDGIPVVRFIYPRWTSLIKAMKKADADIYYYNCGDMGLGQVVNWAHRHGKKVVYSVASDPDCESSLPSLRPLRERVLYRYGLKRTDVVIVQTNKQQQLLNRNFGKHSTVISMPSAGIGGATLTNNEMAEQHHVLWVGRLSAEKRLEWMLDVAEKLKHVKFDIVGAANMDTKYSSGLLSRAREMDNVVIHGRIDHGNLAKFYRRAAVLCCTSTFEGFPNVFLEAWSVGLPVVSTVDPDSVIEKNGLGGFARTPDEVIEWITGILSSPKKHESVSHNCIEYFQRNHSLDVAMPKFEKTFGELCVSN